MSAALASPPGQTEIRSQRLRKTKTGVGVSVQSRPTLTEIRPFPGTDQAWPLWLKSLLVLQWGSAGAVLLVLGSLLPIYATSAFFQYRWGQTFQAVTQLEQQERELRIAHQALRHQVTETLEKKGTRLVPQSPQQVLFVPQPTDVAPADPDEAQILAPRDADPTVSY